MWIQYYQYNTKAKIDAILDFAREYHLTDLAPMSIDYDTTPRVAYGNTGSLMRKTSITIDGVTPMQYLAREAKAIGINVSVWWCIHFFEWWGTSNAVLYSYLSETYHDTSGGADILDFTQSYARSTVIAGLKEFAAANPHVGSVTLDYIRSDGYSTIQTDSAITSFVGETRAAIPDRKIYLDAITVYAPAIHQDVGTMTANNYLDATMGMAAYDPLCKKKWGWDRWNKNNLTIMVANYTEEGSGEFAMTTPSDTRATFRQYSELGYIHFGLFDAADDHWGSAARRAALLEYQKGQLQATAPYPALTSASVTPDTRIDLVIGGNTYTTYNADVTDDVSSQQLKAHIESVEGQRPWIHYIRPTSSTIELSIGDFIP
jgi:hypothetical protein